MAKKKKQPKAKKASLKETSPVEKHVPEEQTESKNPFDFGGLPQRDLKKNLGCG